MTTMLRVVSAILCLALPAPAAAQVTGAIPPATPALKREATVASDLVRIGDLIDNAGASARVPIFRSPDLGQSGAVSAARVVEAVRAHGFPIVETRGVSEIAVTRASRVISVKEIEARIAAALAGQPGLGEAANLVVTIERDARAIHLEPSATAELQPTRLTYDPRTGRFDVTFELPGSAAAKRLPLRYVGSVIETADAAMLMRPLSRGDVVKASDVAIERRPKAEIGTEAMRSVDEIIGRAARRPLRAGTPLRAADLMKPEIVQRNEQVTIVYEAPGLMLTIRGKALESGAEGDTVSVLNIQSKRTVQGTVSGPGQVVVAATNLRPAGPATASTPSQPEGGPPRSE
jgi:flagellar basal body P-ring formation protein FlgA